MVLGDFSLTLLFNRINPIDRRVPKKILKNTFLFGGVITLWIWNALFFIFYMYLFIWMADIIILEITYIAMLLLILFLISNRIVGWYTKSIKMWNISKRKASYISVASIIGILSIPLIIALILSGILNIPLIIWFTLVFRTIFGIPVIITAINSIYLLILILGIVIIGIILAPIVVMRIIGKKFKESLKLILIVQIILVLFTIILNPVLSFFQSVIQVYNFNVQDIRIPLVVATGIYIISIFALSKVKILPMPSKKIEERFKEIIQPTEPVQIPAAVPVGNSTILDVQDLTTYFYTEEGVVKAVEGVSFKIYKGEVLGLVGETGCGKSVTALSILRLVRPPGEIKSGKVFFEDEDLHQKPEDEFLSYRGNRITMIFQDPLNSLNPVFKIGDQISEVYLLHMEDELLIEATKKGTSIYEIAREWSQQMLRDLNIPVPHLIFDRYPHELSGGMRQRVQIAMGLSCGPKLLIADEPTTALDVTVQNQILQLMKDLKKKYNTSILFITHDLGIISKMCDRVAVMYSGFIVEYGDIQKLFIKPYHPYTMGLITSVPVVGKKKEELEIIPGTVPNLIYPPSGCRFHPRCQFCFEPCDSKIPKSIEVEPDYFVACHLYDPEYKSLTEKKIER
jgi:oligopeptide/dipeptide ABC transporter ATP-binding protein